MYFIIFYGMYYMITVVILLSCRGALNGFSGCGFSASFVHHI